MPRARLSVFYRGSHAPHVLIFDTIEAAEAEAGKRHKEGAGVWRTVVQPVEERHPGLVAINGCQDNLGAARGFCAAVQIMAAVYATGWFVVEIATRVW